MKQNDKGQDLKNNNLKKNKKNKIYSNQNNKYQI
jgi:hypothetical protein